MYLVLSATSIDKGFVDYEFFGYLFIFTSAGTFKLTLQFTEDYPNKPPTVRFISRMFHPNSKSYI